MMDVRISVGLVVIPTYRRLGYDPDQISQTNLPSKQTFTAKTVQVHAALLWLVAPLLPLGEALVPNVRPAALGGHD